MSIISKIRNILDMPFVRNTLKLSSSSVVLMFLPLLVTPILSRLYTPADYGDWGMFSSVLFVVDSFIFLSYENSIIVSNDNMEIPNIVSLCLFFSFLAILFTFALFIVGNLAEITFFTNFPSFYLLLLTIFVTSLHTICNKIANRENLYGTMSISNIINGISQASFRLFFGFFPLISYGLILGNVFAQIVSTIFILFNIKLLISSEFWRNVSLKSIRNVAIKYKKFPIYDAPARFVELSVGNFALILLTYFWSKDEVGCYSMVVQFILIPISFIGSAMSNVLYRDLSENINSAENIKISTQRAGKIAFAMSLVPISFLALGGDQLLVLFLGDKWMAAGGMALCLSVFSLPVILSEPLLSIFRVLNKQEQRFRINICILIFSLLFLVVFSVLYNNIYISLIMYAVCTGFFRFLMYHKILKLANLKYSDVSKYWFVVVIIYFVLAIRLFNIIN